MLLLSLSVSHEHAPSLAPSQSLTHAHSLSLSHAPSWSCMFLSLVHTPSGLGTLPLALVRILLGHALSHLSSLSCLHTFPLASTHSLLLALAPSPLRTLPLTKAHSLLLAYALYCPCTFSLFNCKFLLACAPPLAFSVLLSLAFYAISSSLALSR